MRSFIRFLQLTAVASVCALSIVAQGDTKLFKKDGLSFKYPSTWAFNDVSGPDAQDIQVGRPDVDGQIRVWAYRTPVDSPEKIAEAKKVLVDTYVAKTTKDLAAEGGRPQSSPASLDFGAVKADGVKISASLGGEPGAAEIYWPLIGSRLVVITVFRPDRAVKQMAPALDAIRNSIAFETPAAPAKTPEPAKPAPTATPN